MSRYNSDVLFHLQVGIGVSGMPFSTKAENFSTAPRPESLFQGDMEDLVKSPQPPPTPKEQPLCLQVDQRD